MPRRVALVSVEPHADLAKYLEGVGFDVRTYRTPLGAPREGTLVWLPDHASDARTVIDTIRVWIGSKPRLRAIVVSDRPVKLKEVSEGARNRVVLLPAPVFGWQLVDVLRADWFSPS